jgi:hypothetical protein
MIKYSYREYTWNKTIATTPIGFHSFLLCAISLISRSGNDEDEMYDTPFRDSFVEGKYDRNKNINRNAALYLALFLDPSRIRTLDKKHPGF